MSDKISYSKDDKNDTSIIKIEGTIDEDTILDDIFTDLRSNVIIDISNVNHINSCGIRTWVNTMERLTSLKSITFVECSITMIRQFNMISNFGAKGVIKSFKLPYYCEQCEKEYDFTISTEEYLVKYPDFNAPEYECPSCGNALEFDDLEDKYFHFLKTYK